MAAKKVISKVIRTSAFIERRKAGGCGSWLEKKYRRLGDIGRELGLRRSAAYTSVVDGSSVGLMVNYLA